MRRIIVTLLALAAAGVGLSACELRPHHAFTVDVGSDGRDAVAGDGVCEVTAGAGDCTLRAALDEVRSLTSAATPDPSFEVTLETDVVLSRSGTDEDDNATGDLDLLPGDRTLTISGGGHTIDAAGLDRALHLRRGTLRLTDVEITGGLVSGVGGGAIRSELGTSIVVERSTFTANRSVVGGACLQQGGGCSPFLIEGGGAIEAIGRLVIGSSTFDRNSTESQIVGCQFISGLTVCGSAFGGAILTRGQLVVSTSTFDLNSAQGPGTDTVYTTGGGLLTFASSTVVYPGDAQDHLPTAGVVRNSIIVRDDCAAVSVDFTGNVRTEEPCVPGAPPLAALADNGGPTRTRLPLAGSPIVDATAPDGGGLCDGLGLDQRGLTRPAGTACDVGAVERQPSDP